MFKGSRYSNRGWKENIRNNKCIILQQETAYLWEWWTICIHTCCWSRDVVYFGGLSCARWWCRHISGRTHIPTGEEDEYCLHGKDKTRRGPSADRSGDKQFGHVQSVWVMWRISITQEHWILFWIWNPLSCCIKTYLMCLMTYECVLASKMVERNKRVQHVFCAYETSSVHKYAEKTQTGRFESIGRRLWVHCFVYEVKFPLYPCSFLPGFPASFHSPKASMLGWLEGVRHLPRVIVSAVALPVLSNSD